MDVDGYDMPPKYGSSKQFGNDIRSEVKWSGVSKVYVKINIMNSLISYHVATLLDCFVA